MTITTHNYFPRSGAVIVAFLHMALCPLPAQEVPAASSQPKPEVPKLSSEMRVRYAAAQTRIQQDPEFLTAVKRAEEARRVADRIFFEKLRRAEPELKSFVDYLEQARASSQAQASSVAPRQP